MSFQPVTPVGGLAGWSFLNRTKAEQADHFRSSPEVLRDTDYFRENIAGIATAADLVADRRLLKVALGAFGLDSDINKQYFIRKVLEEGTIADDSMANRLVDKRYAEMAESFGFDAPSGPATTAPGFADQIVSAHETRQFEIAVGEQSDALRLALTFQREIPVLATNFPDGKTGWFRILGSPPLRTVIEGAFGLPGEFAALDIDKQAEIISDRTLSLLGSGDVSVFSNPENLETLLSQFLALDGQSGSTAAYSPAASALTILGAGGPAQTPGSATMNALFAALY